MSLHVVNKPIYSFLKNGKNNCYLICLSRVSSKQSLNQAKLLSHKNFNQMIQGTATNLLNIKPAVCFI